MKIAVTGGNGYLGGWVVHELQRDGHSVAVFDSHSRNLLTHESFSPREADGVVHLGWYSKAGDGEPELQRECLDRTRVLLSGLKRRQFVIFASSAAVYGPRDERVKEWIAPQPNCAYSKAKYEAEELVDSFSQHPLCFRFGSLMGRGLMRTKTELCVNAFALAASRGERIEVWNPESYKPVLHVRDAAALVVLAVRRGWFTHRRLRVLNAAEGSYPALRLARFVREHFRKGTIVEVEDRSGPRSCILDCSLLRSVLPLTWKFRTVGDAVSEFEGYSESEGDRNQRDRWNTPSRVETTNTDRCSRVSKPG